MFCGLMKFFSGCDSLTSFASYSLEEQSKNNMGITDIGLRYVNVSVCYKWDKFCGVDVSRTLNYCGWCGTNVTWNIDNETRTLIISGKGDMYNPLEAYSDWKLFKDSYDKVSISEGVTSIGSNAFYSCGNIISFDIPEGVISIGDRAFYACSSLTSFYLPVSVGFVDDCAFCSCSNLVTVSIPNSTAFLNSSVFSSCVNLTTVILPESLSSIPEDTFRGCTSLATISIPDSVETIGEYAFKDCKNLSLFHLPASLSLIEANAFDGCESLTNISFPIGLRRISYQSFYSCKSLKSVIIPASVTPLGQRAFEGCSNLDNMTYLGMSSLDAFFGDSLEGCDKLTSITVLECYNQTATVGNRDLAKIVPCNLCGPNLVFEFGESTGTLFITGTGPLNDFNDSSPAPWAEYSSSMKSVETLEGVTSIGSNSFNGYGNLTTVSLTYTISSIGMNAFKDCKNLETIEYDGFLPPSCDSSAFEGCDKLVCVNVTEIYNSNYFCGIPKCGNFTSSSSSIHSSSKMSSFTSPSSLHSSSKVSSSLEESSSGHVKRSSSSSHKEENVSLGLDLAPSMFAVFVLGALSWILQF